MIVGSSDSPAGPLSPWIQLQGMVEYPLERERLGLYDALRTYTANAAWAAGEEAERGTLAPGKKADLIVMEEDPFGMPLSRLHEARVRETFIDGRRASPMRLSTAAFLGRALLGPRKKV
jgi:predicted amidohydrolase YtcJ